MYRNLRLLHLSSQKTVCAKRFSVPHPFRSERMSEGFPGSRQVALNRVLQLERKLAADKILYRVYCKLMSDYEELGHMSRAEGAGQYFIPHHAIQKAEGDNVKLRVVSTLQPSAIPGFP